MNQVQDQEELKIESQLSISFFSKIAQSVENELNQLVNKSTCLEYPYSGVEVDPIKATQLFQKFITVLEKELTNWVQGYSSMRWLWMLRRLPPHIFVGEVASYDQLLAEVMSAQSRKKEAYLRSANSNIYDVSGATPKRLARFCAGIQYLSRVHSYLRNAGKGASFIFYQDRFPRNIPDKDLEQAAELYDQRVLDGGMLLLSRGGTKLAEDKSGSPELLYVIGCEQQYVPVSNHLMQDIGYEHPSSTQWVLRVRFLPRFVSIALLRELQAGLPSEVSIWSSEATIIARLLRIASAYVDEHQAGYVSLLTRGYLLMPKSKFVDIADEWLTVEDPWLDETFTDQLISSSGNDFLEALKALQGNSYPLKAGPIIRTEQDIICLDLFAASQYFEHILEYPDSKGKIANNRSGHFEKAVQKTIDQSKWKPKHEVAALRGRTLRLSNQNITDIDSIGENDGKLLIVDCKSVIYNSDYDIGDYKIVRNTESEIVKKTQKWQTNKEFFKENPVGDNYDFSGYSDIIAIVCTPTVVFVPIGIATEETETGLRTVSTLNELEKWLGTSANMKD